MSDILELGLYCPECDDFHQDNQLEIEIDRDYVQCIKTKKEIKTWKGSSNWDEWREAKGFDWWMKLVCKDCIHKVEGKCVFTSGISVEDEDIACSGFKSNQP